MRTEITTGGQDSFDSMFQPKGNPLDAFTADFVDNDAAAGQPAGGAGVAWYWEGFEKSFSDIERTFIETIATPEHLVTVMDLSATHTGDFMGYAATGKRFTVCNVQVMRLTDGKPVERWGSTDELGILQQLGLA